MLVWLAAVGAWLPSTEIGLVGYFGASFAASAVLGGVVNRYLVLAAPLLLFAVWRATGTFDAAGEVEPALRDQFALLLAVPIAGGLGLRRLGQR